MPSDATTLARALHAHRDAFKAFLAARVGSAAEAEDILQNGLAKAVQRAGDLRDDEKLVAWFYQLLRHSLVDHYRSKSAARRRNDALGTMIAALGDDTAPAAVLEKQLCACLGGIVDTLKPLQAELLRRVDLGGESVQDAADALRISANNASVTLHRARRELRTRLEAFCGDCAAGACLDCDCAPDGN
ncbi:MAG: sigma-70 family RNA polymerase sigma factor [Candidatus Didemnitutus sp.]|nr:sigma-70 family RNA polymerase sigma factor [Candidatus Didemnitutus sp.]